MRTEKQTIWTRCLSQDSQVVLATKIDWESSRKWTTISHWNRYLILAATIISDIKEVTRWSWQQNLAEEPTSDLFSQSNRTPKPIDQRLQPSRYRIWPAISTQGPPKERSDGGCSKTNKVGSRWDIGRAVQCFAQWNGRNIPKQQRYRWLPRVDANQKFWSQSKTC